MTPPDDGLSQSAVALTPATVLRRLTNSGRASEAPEVSVHLSSGPVIVGWPVRVDTDREQEVVVLAGARGGQLTYALLANVVAVEVREPERFQDVLTDGRLPLPVTGEPVTRLALRREFAPSEAFPVQVDWAAVPDAAPELANLDRLLRGLRQVVRDVCADELGRQAWARIHTLHVVQCDGVKPAVQRVADGILVQLDLSVALPRDLTGELGRQINALL